MTALARRLDPCVNWFRVLARTKGRILWIFPAALLGGYLMAISRGEPISGFFDRFGQRTANAPLLAEAKSLGLDYDRVVAAPTAAVDKPVVWCVDSVDGSSGFVGSQSHPVVWTEPSDNLKSVPGAHGYCWKMLAIVVGVDQGVVRLRPVEKL